jgi:hypothetical protein
VERVVSFVTPPFSRGRHLQLRHRVAATSWASAAGHPGGRRAQPGARPGGSSAASPGSAAPSSGWRRSRTARCMLAGVVVHRSARDASGPTMADVILDANVLVGWLDASDVLAPGVAAHLGSGAYTVAILCGSRKASPTRILRGRSCGRCAPCSPARARSTRHGRAPPTRRVSWCRSTSLAHTSHGVLARAVAAASLGLIVLS